MKAAANNTSAQWLDYVEILVEDLTVGGILTILMDLGFHESRFKAEDGNLYPVADLARLAEVHGDPACTFNLAFWGGPPDSENWYSGTLVTWAMDALLFSLATTDGQQATTIIADIEGLWNEDDATPWDDMPY